MAEYNPDDLIGRTLLLPKNEQGEMLRATIKRKVIETSKLLDNHYDEAIDKINFYLDVGQGRADAIMLYVQILDHLDQQEEQEPTSIMCLNTPLLIMDLLLIGEPMVVLLDLMCKLSLSLALTTMNFLD